MKAIAYYRKSTDKQGCSFARQQVIVESFAGLNDLEIVRDFTETVSGRSQARPQLLAAIEYARVHKTPICISSVSRLSRSVSFGSSLLEDKSIQFFVCDLGMQADSFMLNVLLAVAQKEAELTSRRTKQALAVIKRDNPEKLANKHWDRPNCLPKCWEIRRAKGQATADRFRPFIKMVQDSGVTSYQGIARQLNKLGVLSPRGKKISAAFVRKVCLR